MRRRPAWWRILRGGGGRTGIRTAFLAGMAAAMLAKTIMAGGDLSESGGSSAGSGAGRTDRTVGAPGAERMEEAATAASVGDRRSARGPAGIGSKRRPPGNAGTAGEGSERRLKDGGAGDASAPVRPEAGRSDGTGVPVPSGTGRAEGGGIPEGETAAAGRITGRPEDGRYGGNGASARAKTGQAGVEGVSGITESGGPEEPLVRVYLEGGRRVETVPLETYVRGVVAGEMPASFELEALKAQAIAARTYIVRKLLTGPQDEGGGRRDYDVTDGEADQAYVPLERMRQLERERTEDMERIERAVAETEGLVLVYDGEPIQAVYFSTSGGHTENAEDYWSTEVPYLRSVPSPWDALISPRYEQVIEMGREEFYDRLGIGKRDRKGGIRVLSRTAGGSVKELRVGSKVLSGREVREALGLPSANFSLSVRDDTIRLVCRGHGHGVGMSQYGAQALALAGNDAEQILSWYYRGARLVRSENLAGRFESFKT